MLVTAEEFVPGGEALVLAPDSAELFAELLAILVRLAPSPTPPPTPHTDAPPTPHTDSPSDPGPAPPPFTLQPSPPRVGWDHGQGALWPVPDDRGRDLNLVTGPRWLDEAARRARASLRQFRAPLVIGHADWESQNIRWTGRHPLAVHDWDSVMAQPEAAIAGAAAAVWPADGEPGQAASVEQSEEFLAAYQAARGRPWTGEERQACWVAGIWVRAFNAKKDAASGGGPQLARLSREITARLRRAGLT